MSGLGLNQSRLALMIALAQCGGTASTSRLVELTRLPRTSALHQLGRLHADGYVLTDEPVRVGSTPIWTLDHVRLSADLHKLILDTKPLDLTDES